jgi:hypothetical protein
MKRTTKSILASIPLVVGLAGPAAAALGDAADTSGSNGTEVSIDSLLNQYSGLMPGDRDLDAISQEVLPSQKLTAFTHAATSMNMGYTNQGGDRTSPNQPSGSVHDAAAAPSVATITAAHAAQDTLVGAVASSIAGTSSNSASIGATAEIPAGPVTDPIPDTIPTPIPPAAALIGSGLTALAALRKRDKVSLA